MLHVASMFLEIIYLALPVYVLISRARQFRRDRHRKPLLSFVGVAVWATIIGGGLTITVAYLTGARAPVGQILISSYLAAAVLIILRSFNTALIRLGMMFVPRRHVAAFVMAAVAAMLRAVLLVGLGLTYVMSTVMVFRPKVLPIETPTSVLGVSYERVTFPASDGSRVVGWWIPASDTSERVRRTVLVCHGLGSNKADQLPFARGVVEAGFNVLTIDLRAHGESGGQLTTFGDLERRDILGAVSWLVNHHPDRSERVFGLGTSMGAAAILAAAADPSPMGQHIDAVAVFGTYDDFGTLAHNVCAERFSPVLGWLLEHVGVPFASLHTGTNLSTFRPVDAAVKLWPRPLLVVHGAADSVIPFPRGQFLYQRALQPKWFIQVPEGTHTGILTDPDATRAVITFFDNAKQVL